MGLNGKLELTWVGKDNTKLIEKRILIEDKDKSYGDSKSDNMLIHGDNLLVLKALEKDYAGKIKCIYIDPPYNTKHALENEAYDDNLEHSIWLTIMRDRLLLLKGMLTMGGLIFIQIDDNEQAYLKILCDEIFGRKNFVNCIAIKMSPSSGLKRSHKDKGFIKNKEFILVYSNGQSEINPLYDEWQKFDKHYSVWFDGSKYDSLLSVLNSKFETKVSFKSIMDYDDILSFVVNNSSNIYRTHDPSKWAIENINKSEIVFQNDDMKIYKVFNPSDNSEFELLKTVKNGYNRLEPLSWNIYDNKIVTLRGDLWLEFEKDMGNVAKEGKVKFPASKKPERLIYDILSCCTRENDYVMDAFLGSGTTAAVAQKMNRKWIGIEYGEHAYTLCKTRMDYVIDGDQTGISVKTNWHGGGGYHFYELSEPLFVKHPILNIYQVNKNFDSELFVKAICAIENYTYKPNGNIHGFSSEKHYIHVTREFVSGSYVQDFINHLAEDESITIYCLKYQDDIRLPENVEIVDIMKSVLPKCVDLKEEI